MKNALAVSALVAALAGCDPQPDVVLVGTDGVATVVIAAKPDESSKLAAEELTNHVYMATGKLMPIARGAAPETGAKVFIGTLDAYPCEVPATARDYIAKAKQGEAAWTGTIDGNLHVVGRREVADLYALYHFLESKLGVFWFKAPIKEDPGLYVPKAETIVLKPFAEGREPAFPIRRLDMTCAVWMTPPYGKVTAVRNGFQVSSPALVRFLDKPDSVIYRFYRPRQWRGTISMGGGHGTLCGPIPAKKYFKDHPEYFALIDGKRVPGEQICFSNPDVRRIVADGILENFHKNGDVGEYLFGLVDVMHGWCECEGCRALDAPGETKKNAGAPNISTRFNKTAAAIMELVRKEIPDADLRVWSYAAYRDMPIGVKHDPRVKVQYCDHGRCYGHAFHDPKCPRNRELYQLMLDWLKVTPQVYTYEYFTCSHALYVCHEGIEEQDIKNYHRLGMVGWKNEAAFTGSDWAKKKWAGGEKTFQTNWQWIWMTGKLLWDPTLDGMSLIAQAEEKYYGPAYPAMKKYHALRRKIWDASPVCMGYPAGDARRPTLLGLPGAKEELLGLLDEADLLAANADEVTKFRVRQDRQWLNEYWIKPNDELAEKVSKAYHVNETANPPVIDGDADDACWAGAQYTGDFRLTFGDGDERGRPIRKELATQIGLLYDDENLYVLVKAKEPDPSGIVAEKEGPDAPVWSGDDAIELFLAPPSVDGSYYQIAANLKDAVFDAAHPGCRASWRSDAVVKTKRTADGWTMEMKIPSNRIFGLKRGDVWKMMAARNRPRKGVSWRTCVNTLGGGEHHNTGDYLPIEIGAAYLKNGSFEDVDKDGQPKAWSKISAKSKVVQRGGSKALEMNGCSFFQLVTAGELNQKPYPRRISVSYRAKGPGLLSVYALRYSDVHDAKTGKYKRNFLPSVTIAKQEIGAEEKLCTHEYEIAADEWIGLGFHDEKGPVLLDDVSVNLVSSGQGK